MARSSTISGGGKSGSISNLVGDIEAFGGVIKNLEKLIESLLLDWETLNTYRNLKKELQKHVLAYIV